MTHVLTSVAWPYANGPRHIGHVAGFGVPSDVFSRYMRMRGHDVLMVSGSDEHGTPILVQADKAGMSPQQFIDVNHRLIAEDLVALGVSYDLYTRTTTANHDHVVQQMFLACHKNGYMVEQTQQVAISPSTGRTLPDRFIEGTCPICGYTDARGDQCDNCGNQLDPTDLLSPRSKINGETPEFKDTQHFFLDLPALAEALGEWLDGREASGLWRPNVIRFSRNILEEIRPRAMTRDIDWGITIPLPGWEDNPTKKLYVWFDAVIGYLSASVEWARRIGDPERWREWWNDPEALSYYFMGKDNITFHSQIWPAEMLAHNGRGSRGGEVGPFGELNLPTEVVSSEFLTMEGKQFSTSRSVVIYVRDVLERYQPDALRYFLSAAAPETADSDFSWPEFLKRTNTELVAGWGNLVNRTASMIAKNFGEIPRPESSRTSTGRCSTRSGPASTSSAATSARTSRRRASPRRCAWWARPTPTSRPPSPSSSRARTSASASRPCCTCWRRRSSTSTRSCRPTCRTARRRSTGRSAVRGSSSRCRRSARSRTSTTRPARPTQSSPASIPRPRAGSIAR